MLEGCFNIFFLLFFQSSTGVYFDCDVFNSRMSSFNFCSNQRLFLFLAAITERYSTLYDFVLLVSLAIMITTQTLLIFRFAGLLFLSSHPDTINGLIRVLTQTTVSILLRNDRCNLLHRNVPVDCCSSVVFM